MAKFKSTTKCVHASHVSKLPSHWLECTFLCFQGSTHSMKSQQLYKFFVAFFLAIVLIIHEFEFVLRFHLDNILSKSHLRHLKGRGVLCFWIATMCPPTEFFIIKYLPFYIHVFGRSNYPKHLPFIYWKIISFHTTEQLRVKGLAQRPSIGRLAALGFELSSFQTLVLNHCPRHIKTQFILHAIT